MNLQRREEIRELANWLDVSEWYHATQYQEAIRELLAHIDTLEQTAAERVIARGAAVKPHRFAEIVNQVRDISNQYAGTEQLRERIAYALTPHFERNESPTPDYTGEGSAWMPPVDARDVVVPEYDEIPRDHKWHSLIWDHFHHGGGHVDSPVREAWNLCRRLRPIPADRVLGEGMVAVDPGLLMLLDKTLERCRYSPQHYLRSAIQDALRAKQGGSAT